LGAEVIVAELTMKTLGVVGVLGLFALSLCNVACVGTPEVGATSGAETSSKSSNTDSLGCGNGVTSAPNAWFVGIDQPDQGGLFQEVALMSSNLFGIESVSPVNPEAPASLAFPEDVSQTTALVFEVTFTPGRNSLAFPTIATDSVTNRDQVLTQLQGLGASISCNNIINAQPLNGGSASGGSGAAPLPVDAAGCGDGVTSAPNAWFISVSRTPSNDAVFQQVALMSSNLFGIANVAPVNPSADVNTTTFPADVTKVTGLDFEVTFTPGVDSVGMPDIAHESIENRNKVLLKLQSSGATVDCNNIGVAVPLSQQ